MDLSLLLIVFLAFAVEATAGFGSTLITVTLAAHLMPIHAVLGVFQPVAVGMSLYLALRYRRSIDGRTLLFRVLPAMGTGLVCGLLLYGLPRQLEMKMLFAAVVVGLAVGELVRLRGTGSPRALSRARAGLALFGAGLIHGLFACGGPLVVYVLGRDMPDKGRFRATLAALWITMNLAMLPVYAAAGQITARSLRTSALLLLPLLLGGAVGERLHRRVPLDRFRAGVFWLLLVAGLLLAMRTALEIRGD